MRSESREVEQERQVNLYRHNEIRTRRTDPIYFIADGANNGTNACAKEIVSKQHTDSDTFKIYLSCQEPLPFTPLLFFHFIRSYNFAHLCLLLLLWSRNGAVLHPSFRVRNEIG